ncbi:MAG: hypothetical protein IPK54_04085 [Dokdonella sp.]|jgi:hypothetical protein|uniref:hypothetical protein n=1 Tax=Dokdonella sp. TaxID=2291710 RepID=UPI0025C37BE2|nr:hypothetical protein [Dokdonella sp.]MBK8122740.1 hypothetical protein [Dokdonella sp.]
MSRNLRLRIELNKGRHGMPLSKLAQVCQETTRFLNLLCEDLDLPQPKAGWLAEDFENGSVDFDLRHPEVVDAVLVEFGRQALRMVFGNTYERAELALRIRSETRRQFLRIGTVLDTDEVAHFGVYEGNEARPRQWFDLMHTSEQEAVATRLLDRNAYGEVQGVIHAFFKDPPKPYLSIRELSTGELVKCFFRPDMYQAAVELLEDRDAVVFVEGWLKEDAATGQTREVNAEDFRPAPEFDSELYQGLLGAIPDYTGQLSSEDCVREARGER